MALHPLLAIALTLAPALPLPEADASAANEALAAFLPPAGSVTGIARVEGPIFYRPDNLYEYINGAAEGFIAYNFQRLAVATYEYGDDRIQRVVVDLYEMPSSIDGFGVYSSERSPQLNFLKLGAEGYIVGNLCIFWKDRHYVRLAARTSTPEAQEALLRLARGLAKRLPGRAAAPRLVRVFPKPGLVPKSEKYFARNLLGHAFMPSGFIADYRFGEQRARLFVAIAEDVNAARDAQSQLRAFFGEFGEVLGDAPGVGENAFAGKEPFYGRSILVQDDRVLAGVLGAPDGEAGPQPIRDLLKNTAALLRRSR